MSSSFGRRLYHGTASLAAGTTLVQRRRSSKSSSSTATATAAAAAAAATSTDMEALVAELTARKMTRAIWRGAFATASTTSGSRRRATRKSERRWPRSTRSARRERGRPEQPAGGLGHGADGVQRMGDAFVGAWDVANQAADSCCAPRLQRCGCSVDPTTPHFSADAVAAVRPALEKHSPSTRLRSVLEGDADWDAVSTVAALAMGFRVGPPVEGGRQVQQERVNPAGGVTDPVLGRLWRTAAAARRWGLCWASSRGAARGGHRGARGVAGHGAHHRWGGRRCIAEAEGDREFLARSTVVQRLSMSISSTARTCWRCGGIKEEG